MTESDLLYTQTLETPRDFKQVCCTIHHKSKTAHFNVIGFQLSELIESIFRSLPLSELIESILCSLPLSELIESIFRSLPPE